MSLLEIDLPAGSETHWIREAASRWRIRARVKLCRPLTRSPRKMVQVVELTGAPADLEEVERTLLRSGGPEQVTVMALSPSRRLVRAISPLPPACDLIFRHGAICTACRYVPDPDGRHGDRWSVVVPREPRVLRGITALRMANGGGSRGFFRARQYRPPHSLTPRQAVAIETAHRLGFYAFPRRTNLREIARILGISRPATAELLRRAEGKLLASELSTA